VQVSEACREQNPLFYGYFGILPFRLIPFRLIFTVSFRVTVCLGLGIGLRSGLGEMGLSELGQNRYFMIISFYFMIIL